MPQVANNQKSTTPESDAHSIHVHVVREGVCTHLQRNLEKDSQSWITRGWITSVHNPGGPGKGPYYAVRGTEGNHPRVDSAHITSVRRARWTG